MRGTGRRPVAVVYRQLVVTSCYALPMERNDPYDVELGAGANAQLAEEQERAAIHAAIEFEAYRHIREQRAQSAPTYGYTAQGTRATQQQQQQQGQATSGNLTYNTGASQNMTGGRFPPPSNAFPGMPMMAPATQQVAPQQAAPQQAAPQQAAPQRAPPGSHLEQWQMMHRALHEMEQTQSRPQNKVYGTGFGGDACLGGRHAPSSSIQTTGPPRHGGVFQHRMMEQHLHCQAGAASQAMTRTEAPKPYGGAGLTAFPPNTGFTTNQPDYSGMQQSPQHCHQQGFMQPYAQNFHHPGFMQPPAQNCHQPGFMQPPPQNGHQPGFMQTSPGQPHQSGFMQQSPQHSHQPGFMQQSPQHSYQPGFMQPPPQNFNQPGFNNVENPMMGNNPLLTPSRPVFSCPHLAADYPPYQNTMSCGGNQHHPHNFWQQHRAMQVASPHQHHPDNLWQQHRANVVASSHNYVPGRYDTSQVMQPTSGAFNPVTSSFQQHNIYTPYASAFANPDQEEDDSPLHLLPKSVFDTPWPDSSEETHNQQEPSSYESGSVSTDFDESLNKRIHEVAECMTRLPNFDNLDINESDDNAAERSMSYTKTNRQICGWFRSAAKGRKYTTACQIEKSARTKEVRYIEGQAAYDTKAAEETCANETAQIYAAKSTSTKRIAQAGSAEVTTETELAAGDKVPTSGAEPNSTEYKEEDVRDAEQTRTRARPTPQKKQRGRYARKHD